MGVAAAGAGTLVSAHQATSSVDLATALKTYRLQESRRPARDLVPGWTEPEQMIVRIDRPQRTAWLQEALRGVKVIGVRSAAEAPLASRCRCAHIAWLRIGADQCLSVPRIARGDILLADGDARQSTESQVGLHQRRPRR
jgi:hypothetical protein